MENNEPFDLEAVYDAEIAPLMTQIIEICKKHGMPMMASFCYAKGMEPDDPDGVSHCTTCIPRNLDGGETGWSSPELKAAFLAVRTNQMGGLAAFTITSKQPNMDKQYTIRPLKWEASKCSTMEAYTANVRMGNYRVERYREGFDENKPWQPWKLTYCFDEYYDEGEIDCSSVADAKRKAYDDWKTRILPALKEV